MLRSADRRLALNETVSGEVFNQDWPEHLGSSRERIIHPGSDEFGLADMAILMSAGASGVNATWPGANDAIAVPFRVFKGMTVYQLGWVNGSGTMTDSVDIGVYDTSWNRKVSGGGTARSGASLIQWVDVADTFLAAGKYYLAMSSNGATASNARAVWNVTTTLAGGVGIKDTATASYPLPNPLSGMASATLAAFQPIMFIAARVPF